MLKRTLLALAFTAALGAAGVGFSNTAEARDRHRGHHHHGHHGHRHHDYGHRGHYGHSRVYVPYGAYGYPTPYRTYFGPRYPYPAQFGTAYSHFYGGSRGYSRGGSGVFISFGF